MTPVPHPDYPFLGVRAKDGDEVTRLDWPVGPPTYADGAPVQLYDRVRVLNGHKAGEVHVVTELSVRGWGQPGRYQQWVGKSDAGVDRWWDAPEEQVWIIVDGKNAVYHPGDVERVEKNQGEES